MTRIGTGIAVAALVRRVNAAGGFAAVRARGDAEAGGLLVIVEGRGGEPDRLLERRLDIDDRPLLAPLSPADGVEDYWRRRRERDPDLWVVALDIADAERFAAETIAVR